MRIGTKWTPDESVLCKVQLQGKVVSHGTSMRDNSCAGIESDPSKIIPTVRFSPLSFSFPFPWKAESAQRWIRQSFESNPTTVAQNLQNCREGQHTTAARFFSSPLTADAFLYSSSGPGFTLLQQQREC